MAAPLTLSRRLPVSLFPAAPGPSTGAKAARGVLSASPGPSPSPRTWEQVQRAQPVREVSSSLAPAWHRGRALASTAVARAGAGSTAGTRSGNGAVREVLLVDPARAKVMADEDMGRRRRRARAQRFLEIEAANGAWAVLGLTAALVGEGVTGEGVLGQIALYLNQVASVLEALETHL